MYTQRISLEGSLKNELDREDEDEEGDDQQQPLSSLSPWMPLWINVLNIVSLLKSLLSIITDMGPLQFVGSGARSLSRDVLGLYLFLKFQVQFKYADYFNEGIVQKFDKVVARDGHKVAVHYGYRQYSFRQLQAMTLQIANWLEGEMQRNGKEEEAGGDNGEFQVGLMLGNTPAMVAFLAGVTRVKASSVLFNTNHRADILKNAFEATNCKMFIFDSKYLSALQEVAADLPDISFYMIDQVTDEWLLPDKLALNGDKPESAAAEGVDINRNVLKVQETTAHISRQDLIDRKQITTSLGSILLKHAATPTKTKYNYSLDDTILYLFTSGTTGGKIKAAPMNNIRFLVGFYSQTNAFSVRPDDHIYITLPLYHSFPCAVGLGQCLVGGRTVTLADKFSASRFWSDCIKNKCTVALYIGEIARYLLAQPPSTNDKKHSVRMMLGLGLKKEIWNEFTERFNIAKVAEFYGSSEGNINIFNTHNVAGSCGFVPWYFGPITRLLFPIILIKVDPVTLEPKRNRKGLCKQAKPGDLGLLVGVIKPSYKYTKFLGYTSEEESTKKVIYDIVRRGDQAFVSGDLFEMDLFGNLFFRDRTGDTFRWKGENVSTTEVESVAAQYLNLIDCTAYGVAVPQTDGCAGMLAIKANDDNFGGDQQLDQLYCHMKTRLPEYALPKFIRLTDDIETTSTHKLVKFKLRQEGFDVRRMKPNDRLYYFNKQEGKYCELDTKAWEDINSGVIQF